MHLRLCCIRKLRRSGRKFGAYEGGGVSVSVAYVPIAEYFAGLHVSWPATTTESDFLAQPPLTY